MLADMSSATTPVLAPSGNTAARPAPADFATTTSHASVVARAAASSRRTSGGGGGAARRLARTASGTGAARWEAGSPPVVRPGDRGAAARGGGEWCEVEAPIEAIRLAQARRDAGAHLREHVDGREACVDPVGRLPGNREVVDASGMEVEDVELVARRKSRDARQCDAV